VGTLAPLSRRFRGGKLCPPYGNFTEKQMDAGCSLVADRRSKPAPDTSADGKIFPDPHIRQAMMMEAYIA